MKQLGTLDPRQALCVKYYKEPKSDTFANLKASMIKAGYSEKYADANYGRGLKWIEYLKPTVDMVKKAEKNINEAINLQVNLETPSKSDIELYKIKQDTSKFVLKTLAKQKYNDDDKAKDAPSISVTYINYNQDAPSAQRPAPNAIDAEVIDTP